MADKQLPDINDYINALPVDAEKQNKLYYAFYSDDPRTALESIQDIPKPIRQALFSIRGKIYKGEPYDLNDIIKSAGSAPVPTAEAAPKGLGERDLKPEEASKEAAQLQKEATQRRAMEEISTVPKPSKIKKKSATPFEKKEEELDFFGRPKERKGPKLVPSLPSFEPSSETKTTPPPTAKPSIENSESVASGSELTGIPAIVTAKPPVKEVYAPSLIGDMFNATVRGIASGFFNIPKALSRIPGGFREDIEALRPVPSDIEPNKGFIGKEGRLKEDALNRKKTAELIARTEQKALPEAPISGVGQFTEATASTVPYIVAGAVGGPMATRALGVTAGTEEALRRADVSGKPLSEEQRAAIGTAGAAIGLTEAIPIDRIVGRLVGAGVADKALTNAELVKLLFPKLKDSLKSGGIQYVAEGLQEGLSGLAQDAVESIYGGRKTSEIGKDFFDDLNTGGGAGLVIDILSRFAGSRIGRRRLKQAGIDPQAYKEWVESGEADKAKAEAEEIARKALSPAEPSEPAQTAAEAPPIAPIAQPVSAEQSSTVAIEPEASPEVAPSIVEPPVTATTPPPSASAAAETPVTEAGSVGSVAAVGIKELGLVNPFTGSESTVQVPSSVADKYESLTGPQKEAAAAEILFRTSTPPGNIDNEIQTIKNDLAEIEKNPATIAGLDPYFTSVEDFKSFNNEIVIPYLEYLKTTKAVAEPTTGLEPAKPAVTAPPPATGGGATESKTSATKEITVTNPDGSTEQVAIPEDLANKYESLDGYVKSHADGVILESKDLSSSGIDGFIQQVSTAAQEAEANPDAGVLDAFGGDINALKSYANDFLIPLLKHEKSLKLAAERAAPTVPATAPPPSIAAQPPDAQATVQTSPPSQVPITPQAPPAQQAAGNVAHPKLDDQGQPVIINNPSTPTQDTTWTDPSSTAVFTPEGSTPSKIGNAELKPWSPPQGGWSKVSGTNERLEVRKPFTPDPQKASAAGVIIVEDDGRVWLVSPTNQFGGYDNTFPKGKVEQGLTMQENAIKEAWEETGLKVDIIGVVGDYERSTSKARYYLAVRTGGTPKNMGWESQAVKLTTLQDAKDLLNQQVDKNIISDIEKMTSSGKVAEIKDGTPRKLSSYGPELSKKTGGSNPGGWYQDGSTKWLVKGNKQKTIGTVTLEQSDARASNEVLASKLIQAIDKTGAPDMKLVDLEGKYGSGLGVASKNVPSFKDFDVSNPDHVKAAIKNFATNAWLANYDVLGMGYDNIVITPNGNAMNIDPGGALLFRAQGLPKGQSHGVVNGMLDPSAPEFESMQKTTPEQKEVFGKMTPEQVKESAEQLAKITDEKIVKLVNTYGWGTDAQKAALADNLIQRKNAILQKAGVTTTSSVAPVVQPSPQVTPQPPSSLVATQAQQPPVTATAKLQLGDPTFGMELDASPATVAEYESLSDSDKDNAYNLISGYIGYFEDPTYILNQYPNILSFVQASINTTSNAQVPYSKAVKLYLEDVANQLAGKTNSEQIDIVKQIADQSSGWIAKPPQTASTAATQTAPPPAQAVTQTQQPQTVNISSPAIGVSAIVPNSVALGWGSLTGAGQIDAADVISGAMQNAAYKFMIGDSPAQSLQADINWALQHSSTWYSGVVQDVVVPYLKYIKEELNLKDPSQVLQYISDVGKGWNMVDNWIENVSGYQNYMASQVSQTAPPPSPSVTTQAPPPLQAAPVSQPVQATSPQAQPSTQPATTPAAQLSQSTTAQASTPAQPAQQAPQQVQAMASLLTPHGDFSIPANFLSKYNSMSADNQSSFVKVINKISASRTTTGSSAAAMGFVQDQLDLANQKIAGYDQSISAGTATAFEKERKKYYEELVKPYLEYVLSSGKIAKATGYVAPSGSSLASVSAVPPRPQWVQQYKAQSKGIVAKGEVSNEDALNNYAFLAGLFGKSHSEAKKANTILKNAQKKNGNIQPSIIDQAVQEAKQKYLQFQPFLQVIDKKWIAPIAQYSTEKQPGDEFKFPYSGYVSSVPAGDIDAGKKGKFKAAQDAVVSSLSKTQKNKLKAYTGSLADSVNLSLGQYFNNGYPVPGQVKTAIKTLDSAFKKSKLGENVKLVRNIGSRFFWKWFGMDENGIADHSLDLLKGKSYTEITYASTSMNPDSTVCLQDKSKGKIKLVINAGKNFHGIKVSSFSNVPSEDEVLLPRGTTYVIRDIKRTQSGASPSSNVWEVFVDIVDQTPGEIQ